MDIPVEKRPLPVLINKRSGNNQNKKNKQSESGEAGIIVKKNNIYRHIGENTTYNKVSEDV